MIIIIDERQSVVDAFVGLFERDGVGASGMSATELAAWIETVSPADLASVEAFLVGVCAERTRLCRHITTRSKTVVMAMSEFRSLEETLELFAAGVDDVIRKPVHIHELLARIGAATRRAKAQSESTRVGEIQIYFNGRDIEIGGVPFKLPRRELRILIYLASSIGSRVSKSQIFNAVYGLFNNDIDESVIESHISRLRKRLRQRLGYDPIESTRFLGYRLVSLEEFQAGTLEVAQCVRSTQAESGFMTRKLELLQDRMS